MFYILLLKLSAYCTIHYQSFDFSSFALPLLLFVSVVSLDTRGVGWLRLWDWRLWCSQQDQRADRGRPAYCWPKCTGELVIIFFVKIYYILDGPFEVSPSGIVLENSNYFIYLFVYIFYTRKLWNIYWTHLLWFNIRN